jgi:ABC transporter DrrB family efflux protein
VDTIFARRNISAVRDLLERAGLPSAGIPPIDSRVRVWFNPELDSTETIVPGLVAVIMMVVAALLTSLTVVRERELGSLEGLIATPVRKHEILLGKMLPYLLIALSDCVIVTLLGVVVFEVPFAGSIVLFLATALVFAVAGLSIGMFASVAASSQLLANQIVVLTTMLPSMLLSGFLFPIKSMPEWVQAVTYAVPARYFITICRGILLKVEARRAFELLPELILQAMLSPAIGIMIARGDLAVECGYERLAEVQEEILWICEAAHVPVVWATQVLETLAKTGQPSRAEITDAAMSERAECVMRNKGPHVLEAVDLLERILRRMEAHQHKKRAMLRRLRWWSRVERRIEGWRART